MCKRRDSIELASQAADRLTEACEADIHGTPEIVQIDPKKPTRSGVARAVREAYREISTTPADMAVQLGRLK